MTDTKSKPSIPENMPTEYAELVGTKHTFSGFLFPESRVEMDDTEFYVLEIRWGDAVIRNLDTGEFVCPTFELLLIRSGMKKAKWTRGFPARKAVKTA